jgi:hypothetical protein
MMLGGDMKYVRMLGLATVAAAALMALVGAGTASATEITCGTSTAHGKCVLGQEIHASSIGKTVLDAPFGNIECEMTMAGVVTDAGSATTTARANLTTLDWSNCGGDTFATLATGNLEFHTDPPNGSNTGNGTLTSTGTRVTQVHLGVHCIYETNNTTIGALTGSTNTGGHAVLDISATIPRVGGGGGVFCGSSAPWTGKFTFQTPQGLVIH